jgi:hypothetical protein
VSVVQHAEGTGAPAAASDVSVTFGSTPTPGNIMVAIVNAALTGTISFITSGWTARTLAGGAITGTSGLYRVWEKVAGASEPTTVTAHVSAACRYSMVVLELPANAFDLLTESAASTGTTYAASGLTTTGSDITLDVVCAGGNVGTANTYSWNNSVTTVVNSEILNSVNGAGILVGQKDVAFGVASGTTTATSNRSQTRRGFQIGYKSLWTRSATLNATATLSSARVATRRPSTGLNATGTLSSARVRRQPRSAALNAVATLTSLGSKAKLRTASLAAVATLASVRVRAKIAAATLAAVTTLTAAPTRLRVRTAQLNAVATLNATTTSVGPVVAPTAGPFAWGFTMLAPDAALIPVEAGLDFIEWGFTMLEPGEALIGDPA